MQLLLIDTVPEQPGDEIIKQAMHLCNLLKAYQRVKLNAGAPGVDGITVHRFGCDLAATLKRVSQEISTGEYRPQPVRTVEIPKSNGGVRMLGIPTVHHGVVQLALLQVLLPVFDPGCSKWSFGFRPRVGAHTAVRRAQTHIRDGNRWVVDVDLEKFFDRVNHDVLMGILARPINDKGALRLIRRFLQSGAMAGGLTSPSTQGTPQGGPLSPLLSHIMLDLLDKELKKRGHRFCRYADDCNVYVRSRRAGERLMASMTQFLSKKSKLTVNHRKSAVDRPWHRQFLGYTVTLKKDAPLRIAPTQEKNLKAKSRLVLRPGRGQNIAETMRRLAPKIRGWASYYQLCDVKAALERFDEWMRRRLRAICLETVEAP